MGQVLLELIEVDVAEQIDIGAVRKTERCLKVGVVAENVVEHQELVDIRLQKRPNDRLVFSPE